MQPPPACLNSGNRLPHHVELAGHVDGHGLVPFLVGDLLNRLGGARDAGIVDQNVEAGMLRPEGIVERRDLLRARHVGLDDQGIRQRLPDVVHRSLIDVAKANGSAEFGIAFGDDAADARCASCDDGGFSVEVHCDAPGLGSRGC